VVGTDAIRVAGAVAAHFAVRDGASGDEMRNIVVGVSGRDEALDALRLAREMAVAERDRLIAVAAFVYGDAPTDLDLPEARAAFYAEMEKRTNEALEGLTHTFAPVDESPARALQTAADDEKAEMIVIGSTHRGPLGRVLAGSVGQRLLHGAPCPVAVAPRGYSADEHGPIERIAVGYNGQPECDLALAEALEVAKRTGAALRVVTVSPAFYALHGPPIASAKDVYRARLRRALDMAGDTDVEVEGVIRDGDAGAELVHQSAEVDLLVMGSRGYGPIRHVLLGGASSFVIREAHCPVLVVPRP
jgi:nucleotide-binding universal stress UspA family protein